jgi:hypothetical protein
LEVSRVDQDSGQESRVSLDGDFPSTPGHAGGKVGEARSGADTGGGEDAQHGLGVERGWEQAAFPQRTAVAAVALGAYLFGYEGVLGPLQFLAQSGIEHLVRAPQGDVVALGQFPDPFVRH